MVERKQGSIETLRNSIHRQDQAGPVARPLDFYDEVEEAELAAMKAEMSKESEPEAVEVEAEPEPTEAATGTEMPARGDVEQWTPGEVAVPGTDFGAVMWKYALKMQRSAIMPKWARDLRADEKVPTIWSVMMMGHEHGLNPIQSMTHIILIQGRVGISAQLQRSLLERAGAQLDYEVEPGVSATVSDQHGHSATFTMEEAKRAGLIKSASGWETYPEDMMVARATARLGRRYYATALLGLDYTIEEIRSEA
ncbi:MAG: hypothetical protein ACYCSN_14585 [Acidobacteriaceae bacterium]